MESDDVSICLDELTRLKYYNYIIDKCYKSSKIDIDLLYEVKYIYNNIDKDIDNVKDTNDIAYESLISVKECLCSILKMINEKDIKCNRHSTIDIVRFEDDASIFKNVIQFRKPEHIDSIELNPRYLSLKFILHIFSILYVIVSIILAIKDIDISSYIFCFGLIVGLIPILLEAIIHLSNDIKKKLFNVKSIYDIDIGIMRPSFYYNSNLVYKELNNLNTIDAISIRLDNLRFSIENVFELESITPNFEDTYLAPHVEKLVDIYTNACNVSSELIKCKNAITKIDIAFKAERLLNDNKEYLESLSIRF